MSHKVRLWLAALAAVLVGMAPPAFAVDAKAGASGTAAVARHRVVIQINEDDAKKWHAVLVNINNIQAEFGRSKVAIKVVAIAGGLGLLTADSLAANGVQDAIGAGVEFIACGNSMRAQHIEKGDLIEGVSVVTAGYGELIRRQQEGWAYLRP